MAFPTVAGTATSAFNTNETDHTVDLPASIGAGNLLITSFALYVGGDGSTGTPPTITWPAGWTALYANNAYISGDSDSIFRQEVRYRIADGGEGSTITITTDSAKRSAHCVYRLTTWHGTTPPEGVGLGETSSSANPDPPTLTPSWGAGDTLWLTYVTFRCDSNDANVSGYPSSYTDGFTSNDIAVNFRMTSGTSRRALNTASENPGTFTLTAARRNIAGTVGVRAAAGGGGLAIPVVLNHYRQRKT